MDKRGKNKQAQVTIFIIIALVIVASIIIYFLWVQPKYITPSSGSGLYIESCMNDAVKSSMDGLAKQAGFENPEFFYLYQNDRIGYLCYTNLYYTSCVNQKPFLKQHFETQLENTVREKIYKCYDNSLNELQRKGYQVQGSEKDFAISLEPGRVIVDLNAPVTLSKETSVKFTKFEASTNSEIYDMLMIATSIIQQETKYGDSDTDSMRMYYPDFSIDKIRRGDGTNIYIIEDKIAKTKFQFATRSFAWPAGLGGDTNLV